MKNWVVYLAAIAGFAIYGATTTADRDESGAIVGEGSIDAFSMRVGDCFNDIDSFDEVSSVPGVPCSEPHDNETYAVFDVSIEEYPGDDRFAQALIPALRHDPLRQLGEVSLNIRVGKHGRRFGANLA